MSGRGEVQEEGKLHRREFGEVTTTLSESEGQDQKFGYVTLVYCVKRRDCRGFTFVVAKNSNVEDVDKYIEQTYSETAEVYDKITGLQFVKSYMELDLTEPVPAGWKITFHHEPMKLYQCDVDNFKSPNWPPCIQLSVYPVDNPVQRLEYKIPLLGVQQRFNRQVTVYLDQSDGSKSLEKEDMMSKSGEIEKTEDESFSPQPTGIYMAADLSGTFHLHDKSAQSFNWEQYGFRLHSPQGVVSERCLVAVTPLVGGDFVFPEGTVLVSAVYTVSVNKPLLKPLTIELQHCVNLRTAGQTECLKFVQGSFDSKPPYQFEIVEGGVFSVGSRYGSIEQDKFSPIAIVAEMSNGGGDQQENENENTNGGSVNGGGSHDTSSSESSGEDGGPPNNDSESAVSHVLEKDESIASESSSTHCFSSEEHSSEERHVEDRAVTDKVTLVSPSDVFYTGILYYVPKEDHWSAIFTVIKDLNTFREYMERHNTNADNEITIQGLQFVNDSVQLNLTGTVPKGWRIWANHEPVKLYWCDINKFKSPECTEPPHCLLSVYPVDEPDPEMLLKYKIPLEGVVLKSEQVAIHIIRSHNLLKLHGSQTEGVAAGNASLHIKNERDKSATSAITKNKADLSEVFSSSLPVFRVIVTACEQEELLAPSEAAYILDTVKGQTGADQLIRCIQTVVKYRPDMLDVFLSILQEKGNLPVKAVAENIAMSRDTSH